MVMTADILESDIQSYYVPLIAVPVRIAADVSVPLQYINSRSESK